MRLIDAHCHFDFPEFDQQRQQVLESARAIGLSHLVIPGVRRADWGRVSRVASEYEGLYYCLGIHPWFVGEHSTADLRALEQSLDVRPERCVGLGECGLDRLRGSLSEQVPWFEEQIDIAARTRVPLVVHSVRTHDQVLGILRRKQFPGKVLIHGFSGSYQQAAALVDLGCFLGVGGVVTRDQAKKTRDALKRVPLDSLVLETDAPDMAPKGVAKGKNSPAFLDRILSALATLRGEHEEHLAHVLLGNVQRFYGWDESVPSER